MNMQSTQTNIPQLSADELKPYGPLASLIGVWEGDKGDDLAPDDARTGTENNKFRERMVMEPIGLVQNHEQILYGLRYRTMAWRIGEENSFHEEVGYWLWDAKAQEVMKCFLVPRGISVVAGGSANENSKEFSVEAKVGSEIFGICSNPFLDKEFKTVAFKLNMKLEGDKLTYDEDTQLKMKNRPDVFHHTDKNTLRKI